MSDVVWMTYSVVPVEGSPSSLTITFIDPDGSDLVMTGLPTEGSVLWPGMVVAPDGSAVDWPGWTQEPDGSWVAGDAYDWARPTVTVRFDLGAESTHSVDYPAGSPTCAVGGTIDDASTALTPATAPETSTVTSPPDPPSDAWPPIVLIVVSLSAGLGLERYRLRRTRRPDR